MRSHNLREGGRALGIAFEIVMLAILLLAGDVSAVPVEQWNKTFGGTGNDYAYSVQQTSDGGYVFVGFTYSYRWGGSDAWLIKTDTNGNLQWNKRFGGTKLTGVGENYAYFVQQTTDGGYILAGYTDSYGTGNGDAWLIKTDTNGNHEWNKTFGGINPDWAYSVYQTLDGGYIIAGRTNSFGAGNDDAWLIKTDVNGNQEWNKTFGDMGYERFNSVRQTSDGSYILGGEPSAWLVKIDTTGNQIWNKTIDPYSDSAKTVQQTSDGGYILVGLAHSYYWNIWNDWHDALLIKTDANGNLQWNKTFGGFADNRAYSVQQSLDGGYILTGSTNSYGAGFFDAWLIKTDVNGNQQWNKTFGGIDFDETYSVQQTSDEGYILVGNTYSYGVGGSDVWLIKVSSDALRQLPNITSFAPSSPVNDVEGATRTFNITLNQTANVTWFINGTQVQSNKYVMKSTYTNTSAALETWNITATATNTNGTTSLEWTWIVAENLKGDINDNGIPADAGDLVLMKRASIGEIIADSRYDLNNNRQFADAGDLVLMKRASIGEINL